MQRLVYSPKAYVYVKTQSGIVPLSHDLVRGSVTRRINAVSSAELTIRNTERKYTQAGDPTFRPMDPITIYLARLPEHPVQVFTGFLDETPYYQMYPGTVNLTASCTLKRLQYTFWDPALPYVTAFMAKYGWLHNMTDGTLYNQAAQLGNQPAQLSGHGSGHSSSGGSQGGSGGGTIGLVGDSLTVGVQSFGNLDKYLGSGWHIHYSAQTGISTQQGIERIRSMKESVNPPIWVIGLGTNDSSPAVFKKEMKKALDLCGATTVYWVNIKKPGAGPFNRVINQVAQNYSNVHIIDWHSYSGTLSDGIHPDGTGWRKRAQMIANAVKGTTTSGGTGTGLATTGDAFNQQEFNDSSIGKLLYHVMHEIGHWDARTIAIEKLPADIPDRVARLIKSMDPSIAEVDKSLGDYFSKIIGSSSNGSSNTVASNNATNADVQGLDNIVPFIKQKAEHYGVPPAMVLAVMDIESGYGSNMHSPGSQYYGWFQIDTGGSRYSGPITVAQAENLGYSSELFIRAAKKELDANSSYSKESNWLAWAMKTQGVNCTNNPLYCSSWSSSIAKAKKYLSQFGNNTPNIGPRDSGVQADGNHVHNTGPRDSGVQADANHVKAAKRSKAGSTSTSNSDIGSWYTGPVSGGYTPSRIDMGVDFATKGDIHAIGNATVTYNGYEGSDANGAGGPFLIYQLNEGPLSNAYVYVAEKWRPTKSYRKGDSISKGEVIGKITPGGSIEIGWAGGPEGNWNTLANVHHEYTHDGLQTRSGKAFARLVLKFGGTIGGTNGPPDPGPGEFFPGAPGAKWDGNGSGQPSAADLANGNDNSATASAFATFFNFPSQEEVLEARLLQGDKSLLNDKPLLEFIEQLCQGSMRNFQSLPNGDFFAFYPDYFGSAETASGKPYRPPYWDISDLEILDGNIQLTDEALVTHMYVVGDTIPGLGGNGQVAFQEVLRSRGVVTIFNAGVADFINKSNAKNAPFLGTPEAANKFLQRYGARPLYDPEPLIRSPYMEAFTAFQKFMLAWSRQFLSTFEFTFMPELYPGGIVRFPTHGIQMYVDEVHHEFDYENGFTTQANLSAPSAVHDKSNRIASGMILDNALGPKK